MSAQEVIGIMGGSGLYSLLSANKTETVVVSTIYGEPSAPVQITEIGGHSVCFLPRHGIAHEIPPHRVNYKANLDAFRQLGVRKILATHALGSLNPAMKPGDFVLSDQFVNRTWGRDDTYFHGPETVHISVSDPFCHSVRHLLQRELQMADFRFHSNATMLVIQGPRYNTRAENLDAYRAGYDVISMTGYPEAVLARELGVCYASIGFITDMACVLGSEEHPEQPASHAEVVQTFQDSLHRVTQVLIGAIHHMGGIEENCICANSRKGASSI